MTSIGLAIMLVAVPPGDAGSQLLASVTPQDTACIAPRMALEGRASPLDSLTFMVGGHAVKVCYGSPSAKGRTMIGGSKVPYRRLWRTGANEPTMIHATAPITMAGLELEAGSYSLYTVPGEKEWVVIVNRSITQWGHKGRYTEEVEAQEVGRATVSSEPMEEHMESLTFRAEAGSEGGATLVLEWEHTRVRIPVTSGGS